MPEIIVRVRYRVAAAPEPRTQRRADWGLCARLWGLRAYAHPARSLNSVEPFKAARRLFSALLNVCQDAKRRVTKPFERVSFGRVSLHVQQHGARNVEPAGTSVGEIRNV